MAGDGKIGFDTVVSGQVQDEFNQIAGRLESLLSQREADVKSAMAEYQADGVSDRYQGVEARWTKAANGVREVITQIRASLGESDGIAQQTVQRAGAAVDSIG